MQVGMAMVEAKKAVMGDDGREYLVYAIEELQQKQESLSGQLLLLALWASSENQNRRGYYYNQVSDVFYNPELIDFIHSKNASTDLSFAAIKAFTPPRLNHTFDDYWTWVLERKAEADQRPSYSYGRQQANSYNFGLGITISSFNKTLWNEDLILGRSLKSIDSRNRYRFSSLKELLEKDFKSKRPSDVYREYIALESFLNDTSFDGCFGDYLNSKESWSKEDLARFNRFEFRNAQENSGLFLYFTTKNVASLGPSTQVRMRKLLFEQDRKVWEKLVEQAPRYAKGKTFKHLQELIEEINVNLGRSEAEDFELLNASELRREYTIFIAESILFEGPKYNANRLHGLSSIALSAVPGEHLLDMYSKEYSKILHLVKTKLAAGATATSIDEIEDVAEGEGNGKVAARYAGKLTLSQTVAFLLATFYPKSWLRGSAENGPYILADLLEHGEDLSIIQLLSEIMFDVVPCVPTEKEWRTTALEVGFDLPANMFIPLVVSSQAMDSKKKKTYPPIVVEARRNFGLK